MGSLQYLATLPSLWYNTLTMGGARSRRKGATFERSIAAYLREHLDGLEIKRGIQFRGGGEEQADVIGVPHVHFELKNHSRVNYRAALKQALQDAGEGEIAIVVAKDDRDFPVVHMKFDDFVTHFLSIFCRDKNLNNSFCDSGQILRVLQQALKSLEELEQKVTGEIANNDQTAKTVT